MWSGYNDWEKENDAILREIGLRVQNERTEENLEKPNPKQEERQQILPKEEKERQEDLKMTASEKIPSQNIPEKEEREEDLNEDYDEQIKRMLDEYFETLEKYKHKLLRLTPLEALQFINENRVPPEVLDNIVIYGDKVTTREELEKLEKQPIQRGE